LRAILHSGTGTAPERTLLDILDETIRATPEAPALDDGLTCLDYAGLRTEVDRLAAELGEAGVGHGDRVGIRVPSGIADLYVAILAVLAAGAAYVPVDADDPDERAALVFEEAAVQAVITEGPEITVFGPGNPPEAPTPADDAWIIFTSGSTGRPKGVAVTHRSAAAFVDAEARLFLEGQKPIGPGDRVLAGLSVAFDASCEEMWLAWRHGGCLVPAPRALVRTGVDLGPWLVEQGITIVSTVPTLASLWPAEALDAVRLLIFGGEACPAELAERLTEGREVWNTYGPTEATVVACAAKLTGEGPVRIGLPLAGWDLAVIGKDGEPVEDGETGELVIGGVGLARYLDPVKDAEKYAPLPALGWSRAYRSGDLVKADPAGLIFVGRADDQVKLGGRRIELGEVDAALQALPGVTGAAAAVRNGQLLVGYVVTGAGFETQQALLRLRSALPAALVPRIAIVDSLPTRTSGKVDRDALPWPLPGNVPAAELTRTETWLAEQWTAVLGIAPEGPDADFFTDGGSSLTAARLVSALRERYSSIAVQDIYQNPTVRALAATMDGSDSTVTDRFVDPVRKRAAIVQALLMVPLLTVGALPWVTALATINNLIDLPWAPTVSWWWVLAGWIAFVSPAGRMGIAAGGARLLLAGVTPGTYPRAGSVHLRLWTAEQLAARIGAASLSSAPWISTYARLLGARMGADVDLHSLPPITGMLTIGPHAAVEPEVDLSGYWLDGDRLHLGEIRIGPAATVGARSTLFPGAWIGAGARVMPGSAVTGDVPAGERWAGAPAQRRGKAAKTPARPLRSRVWITMYGVAAQFLGALPLIAALPGLFVLNDSVRGTRTLGAALQAALLGVPLATVVSMATFAALTIVAVRLLGIGLKAGDHPVHSRQAWQAWTTSRLMSMARVWLFPVYASTLTPAWLRILGMKVGRGVELSTVLALPTMTSVADGAFLADDTMIAPYELGGGRLKVARARIGKRAFLGNSGMTAPGRKVPKGGLVGVLSSTPKKAKRGSSYLGMPPVKLRRTAEPSDQSRTFAPPARLKVARAVVELCRLLPAMATVALGVMVVAAMEWLWGGGRGAWGGGWELGIGWAVLAGGGVLLGAGIVAAAVTSVTKWALLGRVRKGNRPLWSSFVWRNELADNFVELLAAPWFAQAWIGTGPHNLWLRTLGVRVGRGVWCETYWLPEADLIELGDGASVNRGCVLQTHLFHDRVMSIDTVHLAPGATLGPHGVVLPAASVGTNTTIGPASLVMRGETVPAQSRWLGNPITAWSDKDTG
jgi:non-ribosomal peptide synthetase-like protein